MSIYDYQGNIITADVESIIVNVKDYGATGDGITDDASAIQDALDALASTGGIIFFPKGTYTLKSSLIYYSYQSLIFENGAKLKSGLSSLNNLMRCYCDSTITGYNGTHDVRIIGGTFEGGSYQLDCTLLGMAHSKNILIDRCSFLNGMVGYHNVEINSSSNVRITNCYFTRGNRVTSGGEMIQVDIPGTAQYPWDSVNADGTICKYIEIDNCYFTQNDTSTGIGNHNGSHKYIRIHDNVFDGITSERGAIDFSDGVSNVDIYNNTFVGCTIGIGSSGATYYIHDNRFVDATTAISGSTSISHNNMINGTYTA